MNERANSIRRLPLFALLVAFACDKNAEPVGQPPEPVAAAPAARAAPPNPHTAGDPHAGLAMPDPHGGIDPHGGMDPHAASDPAQALDGTIEVAPALAAQVKPGDTIFLAARKVDENGQPLGAPVAVGILEAGTFPMPFHLEAANAMMPGTRFEGQVVIKARVDRDGEAKTTEPGDIEGTVRATIPAKGLKLVLDTPVP